MGKIKAAIATVLVVLLFGGAIVEAHFGNTLYLFKFILLLFFGFCFGMIVFCVYQLFLTIFND